MLGRPQGTHCKSGCGFVTSVPSVTNVYYFFYGLPRRVSFRSLRLRLRQCLLWFRVHVCCRAAVWPRICGAAHPSCRALVMLPRTRMLPLIRGAAHSHTAAIHSAAHLYAAAHPWCRACGQMVSSSTCCRVPCCRAVLPVAAFHAAAQFSVLPRPMLPHSSTCCRVPCCRAVLCIAASHDAAQFYVLPRSMLPRSSLCCRLPWCRACGQMVSSSLCAASHDAAQFYLLPRPMVPRGRPNGRSSTCCRVPWCRAGGQMVSVLCVAASHGAARAAKWS